MAKLLLVRHGHVEGIEPPRFRGRADLALTSKGQAQAREVAHCIAARWRPVRVYASPLQRCRQTAGEIASACGVPTVVLDGLNDLDYGAWQGRTHAEMQRHSPALYDRWFAAPDLVRFPGGESLQDLAARTAEVLRLALERHGGDTLVLVGHDSSLRAMLLQLLELPLARYWRLICAPASLSEADLETSGARVISINETQHLGRTQSP